MNKKETVKVCIILLVLFVAGLSLMLWREKHRTTVPEPLPPVVGENMTPITATGTIVCLEPLNNTGAQDLSCAVGLKDDNGTTYALRHRTSADNSTTLSGKRIQVMGSLSQSEIPYKAAGTITIDSFIFE